MCGVRVIDGKDGKISWVDFVELASQLGSSKPFLCVAETSVCTHSHGQAIPDKKYNVKDVIPTDTLVDLFASKTIITA